MSDRLKAIRKVFGVPDVFTVKPSTYGEIDPVVEEAKLHRFCNDCGGNKESGHHLDCETPEVELKG